MKNITKYRQITSGQRVIIQAMLKAGYKKAEIAREIGCHRSSVGREVRRGSVEQLEEIRTTSKRIEIPLTKKVMKYFADTGQREYDERRQKCRKRYAIFIESGYADFIDKLILSDPRRYSPDAANELARREGYKGVSTKTLYNWIDGGLLKAKNIDLLLKVKRKPPTRIKEQKRIIGESIDNRPENANTAVNSGILRRQRGWERPYRADNNACGAANADRADV